MMRWDVRLSEAEAWYEAMTHFQNPAELEIWAHRRLSNLRERCSEECDHEGGGHVIAEERFNRLCKCGHTLELHDDQAVCRALVPGHKSCQCMQFDGAQ